VLCHRQIDSLSVVSDMAVKQCDADYLRSTGSYVNRISVRRTITTRLPRFTAITTTTTDVYA